MWKNLSTGWRAVLWGPGWKDWANFHLLGDFWLLRVIFAKITELEQIIGLLFPQWKWCVNFEKNGLGNTFGDVVTNAFGHPDFYAGLPDGIHFHTETHKSGTFWEALELKFSISSTTIWYLCIFGNLLYFLDIFVNFMAFVIYSQFWYMV
jgi:hypothetical protein